MIAWCRSIDSATKLYPEAQYNNTGNKFDNQILQNTLCENGSKCATNAIELNTSLHCTAVHASKSIKLWLRMNMLMGFFRSFDDCPITSIAVTFPVIPTNIFILTKMIYDR